MLNGLGLFEGIGGLTSALAPWVRPVALCEVDRHCQAVLLTRMAAGDLPLAPIWDDVRTLDAAQLPVVDIIYGGFPCQDISLAGRGAGLAGERSGLVFEVLRLVDECRPTYVFLENVPAIRTRGGERVVKELASRGYDCRWDCLAASDVGAPHQRSRWFLLARVVHADGELVRTVPCVPRGTDTESARAGGIYAGWWSTEPGVGRVAHGLPHRMDRLRGLGNAVVPAQARLAFTKLLGLEA